MMPNESPIALDQGPNDAAVKLNIKYAVLTGEAWALAGASMRTGDIPLRRLDDDAGQRGIYDVLKTTARIAGAHVETVMQRAGLVAIAQPLAAAVLDRAGALLASIDTGNRNQFLVNLSTPGEGQGWDALELLAYMFQREITSVYVGGNADLVRQARARMASAVCWLLSHFSGAEREVRMIALLFQGAIDAGEKVQLRQGLQTPSLPDLGLFETMQRLRKQDEALFNKTTHIFRHWVFPFLATLDERALLKNMATALQALRAPEGLQDLLYARTRQNGEIAAGQLARPSRRRNVFYITLAFWHKVKANPLALAQLQAHESHHLDPDRPRVSAGEEETIAMHKEKLARDTFCHQHPAATPPELRAMLPQ